MLSVLLFSIAAGEDYISNGDTLTFDETTLSACFIVTILDDQLPETAEFFSLELTQIDPAAVIPDPIADVRIDNNDSESHYMLSVLMTSISFVTIYT